MLYPANNPCVITAELLTPFQLSLFPVITSPSRLLFEESGASSPACNIYPELFEEVMELFLYVNRVGTLLGILTPSQAPDIVFFIVVPSVTRVVCPKIKAKFVARMNNSIILLIIVLILF